jgi:hypothetical protein
MKNEVMLENGRMWLDEDDTTRIEWSPGAHLTLADAEASMAGYDRLRQGRRLTLVVDSRGIREFSREARRLYARPQTAQITAAVALLIDSPFNATMGNFYLQINKPVVPTRLFASEAEAFEWLGAFTGQQQVPTGEEQRR